MSKVVASACVHSQYESCDFTHKQCYCYVVTILHHMHYFSSVLLLWPRSIYNTYCNEDELSI